MTTAINDTRAIRGGQMKGKESEVLPPSGLVRIKKPSFRTQKLEIRRAHIKRHHLA